MPYRFYSGLLLAELAVLGTLGVSRYTASVDTIPVDEEHDVLVTQTGDDASDNKPTAVSFAIPSSDQRHPFTFATAKRRAERLARLLPDALTEATRPVSATTVTALQRGDMLASLLSLFDDPREGTVLTVRNGTIVWAYPQNSTSPSNSATSRSGGGGGSDAPTPRRGGGGSAPHANADGQLERHDHQTDGAGGTININGATTGVLTSIRGGTSFASYSTGDLLIGSMGGGVLEKRAIGNEADVLTVSGGTAIWGTIASLTLATNDNRYVNVSGDTMTGSLQVTGGVHASATLASSGSLTWEGSASGASLYIASSINGAGLTDCDLAANVLQWNDATGRFSCATISNEIGTLAFSGGVLRLGDERYLRTSGGTMTGNLTVRATISGSLITQNGAGSNYFMGNVGIGKTSPGTALDVVGAVRASTFFDLASPNADILKVQGVSFIARPGSSNTVTFGNASNGYWQTLAFYTGNGSSATEALRITNTGDVGINTSAPKAKLDVLGTISGSLITQNGSGSNYFLGKVGIGTMAPQQALQIGDTNVTRVINFAGARALVGYSSVLNTLVLQGGTSKGISFIVNDATFGSSEVARLDSAGYFGVGTITPNARLHILGKDDTATHGIIIDADGEATDYALQIRTNTTVSNISDSDTKFIVLGSGNVGIGKITPSTKLDVLGTISGSLITQNGAGSNYFRGNVGIGTTTPSAQLQITPSGTDAIFINNSAGAMRADFGFDGTSNYLERMRNSAGTIVLQLATNAGTPTYFNAGSVGIGKTVPSTKLDVLGTISGSLITQNGAGNNYFMGNVGIGITAPTQKLQVEGSILAKDTAGSAGAVYVFDTDHGISRTSGELYVKSNAAISMRPSGAESARFTSAGLVINNSNGANFDLLVKQLTSGTVFFADASTGNVGIGTAAPKAKLDVVGTISGATVLGSNGITTKVVAAACDDTNVQATDGTICIDSANGRIYFRYGAGWHYAAQTAGFQIPNLVWNGKNETDGLETGDMVVGRLDQRMNDGALHGIWEKFDFLTELTETIEAHPELLASAGNDSYAASQSMSLGEVQNLMVDGSLVVQQSATFRSDVDIFGTLSISSQQAGTATVPAKETIVQVLFPQPFASIPIVTLTPEVMPFAFWTVTNKTQEGFTIAISAAGEYDLPFSWVAIPLHQVANPNDPDDSNNAQSSTSSSSSESSESSASSSSDSPGEGDGSAGTGDADASSDASDSSGVSSAAPTEGCCSESSESSNSSISSTSTTSSSSTSSETDARADEADVASATQE